MKASNHDTAILVFSKPAREESLSKKVIAHHHLNNIRSLKGLRNRVISLAQSTGLPTILSEHQEGASFGEKLTYAIGQVFEQGYQHVIAIGGDCPELSRDDLLHAARQVKNNKPVLGPDKRNGAYLIALSRTHFDPTALARLPWQTENTFDSLCYHLLDAAILTTKFDLNNAGDLKWIIQSAIRKIRKLLFSFLELEEVITTYSIHSYAFNLQPAISRRGPPQPSLNC